jgi:hypothetical protein
VEAPNNPAPWTIRAAKITKKILYKKKKTCINSILTRFSVMLVDGIRNVPFLLCQHCIFIPYWLKINVSTKKSKIGKNS